MWSYSKRTGPCSELRVVELATSMVSGPFCGQMLGDLGADVLKIEGLDGDIMRSVPPHREDFSGQFLQFNRNKRCIAIDLKSPKGVDIVRRLIADADVLVENFRPGVTSRLKLDYESLRSLNPRLVYVSINGFGSSGPYTKLPAYDQVIQGLSGFMSVQGDEQPAAIRSVIVDKVTALSAVAATLAAVVERSVGGVGQHVEVAMLDAFAAMMLPEFIAAHCFADQPAAPLPPAGIYKPLRTLDGHVVGLIVQDHQFKAICCALEREDLIEEPRYATAAKRFADMSDLLSALEEVTSTMTTQEVLERLWANATIAIAPVNTVEDFIADPQVAHNGAVFTLHDAQIGPVRQLGPFARFASLDPASFSRAPRLGEHTDEILYDMGFDEEAVVALRAERVVA